MSNYSTTQEHNHVFTKIGSTTRDTKLRCMKCGSFAPGKPLCDECTAEIMKVVEARRWRMQIMFYSILFMGIVSYLLLL